MQERYQNGASFNGRVARSKAPILSTLNTLYCLKHFQSKGLSKSLLGVILQLFINEQSGRTKVNEVDEQKIKLFFI